MKSDEIVKIKSNGYYYNVYGDDAYVVSYIMKYKLFLKDGIVTAGFPGDLLDYVLTYLRKNKVSYIVDGDIENSKYYGNLNQYKKCLRKDLPVDLDYENRKSYKGNFQIAFLDEEVEQYIIGENISPDAEIVKIVYNNDVGSINTLKSGEQFKIVSKSIIYE